MFHTLLESGPRKRARADTVWLSAIIHAAIIAGAVTLTPVGQISRAAVNIPGRVYFVDPALRISPKPQPPAGSGEEPQPGAARLPESKEISAQPAPRDVSASEGTGGGPSADADPASGAHDDDMIAIAYAERPAMALADNSRPVYPDSLRARNVEGAVLARFVVDTSGRVEPGSVAIVTADHELFAAAVSTALVNDRFLPAEVGGRKVRMLVEQRFEFSIERQ